MMTRNAWISAVIVVLAASGALGIIVFNINWRGHYVYCAHSDCLSLETFGRFSLPFAFLFVKHAVLLFALWFVVAMLYRGARRIYGRLRGRIGSTHVVS